MDDPHRSHQPADDPRRRPDRDAPRGARWPAVVGIVIAIAVLALIVYLHLSGAIGPGIHSGG